jgi:cytochrome P450
MSSSPHPDFDFAKEKAPDLHGILAEMRDAGPVVAARYLGRPAWVITRHAELRTAFRDEDRFHSATIQEPLVGPTMQSMVGQKHRRNRGLISSAFIPSAIERLSAEIIEPLAHELLAELEKEAEFDLIARFTHRFPAAVITRMLGIPVHDEKQFLDWALELFNFPWDPTGARGAWAHFTDYLAPVLRARRADPADDLLSMLLQAELDGQKLTDAEILSFIGILYPAGSDTAFKSMGSMMLGVLTHPHVRDRALTDPDSRGAIAEEAMRWEPPVAVLPRRANRDFELADAPIRAGDPVIFAIASANRDERVFADPDVFDPDRARLKESLVFGHGPHFCLGAQLAREEMRIGLGAMLERFPRMELIDPTSVEMLGAILRGPRSLHVRVDPAT